MLSTIPAFFSASDSMLGIGNPFSSLENGFTPWDDYGEFFSNDTYCNFDSLSKPAGSSSGSEEPNELNQSDPTPANSNSNSDQDPNQTTATAATTTTTATTAVVSVVDERKRRRMISNRESARRSRMRKQKHLENLRNQVNRLRIENRELTNRLRFVLYHCHSVRRENDQLRSEHSILRQKLSNIRQTLMFRQLQQYTSAWPCNNIITTEQTPSSLITS